METKYMGNERRANKRLRINCIVIYRVNEPLSTRFMTKGKDMQAKMLDLSQSGMALETDYDIPVSTVLSMRFTLLNVDSNAVNLSGPMEVTGEVRSNVALENNEHRLGIFFKSLKRINVG